MLVLSKENVINELSLEVNAQVISSDRKVRLKGRINNLVLDMVERVELSTYKNLAHTQNGALNKGYIVGDDGTFFCKGLSQEIEDEILKLVDFDDLEETEENITKYFFRLKRDREESEQD